MPAFRKLILISLSIIIIAALLLIRAYKQISSTPRISPTRPPTLHPPTFTPTLTPPPTPTQTPTPTITPTPPTDNQLARALLEALWIEDNERVEHLLKRTLDATPYLQFLLARIQVQQHRADEAIPRLQALTAQAGQSVPQEVYLVLARAFEDTGRAADALDAYRTYVARQPTPPLADIAYYQMAHLQKEWGDWAEADQSYRRAIALAQGDNRYRWQWERARMLAEHLRVEEALEAYTALLQANVPPIWRAQAYLDRGRMLLLLGRPQEAYRDLRACVELAVETQGGSRPAHVHPELIPYAYRALLILVEAKQPVDDYTRGVVDVESGAYGPGSKALLYYLRNITAHHGDAHAYLARALKGLGNIQGAIQQWETIIRTHPECPCWDTAWFQLAALYRQVGEPQRSVRLLRELTRHPQASPDLRARARLAIADHWLREGNTENALSEYVRLAYETPGTREGTRAALIAAVLYLPQHPRNAIALIEHSLNAAPHPAWEPPLRYWLGVAYARVGEEDAARQQWEHLAATRPNTVYAFRAAQRLRALGSPIPRWRPPAGTEETAPLSVLVSPDERIAQWQQQVHVDPTTGNLLQRAAAYESAGMDTAAISTYTSVLQHLEDEQALITLGTILRDSGYPQLGIQAALRSMKLRGQSLNQLPAAYWPLLYPTPARSYITDIAQEFDLDPALMYAIIRQESHFATVATSTANARGLMQLMPGTARDAARGLGLSIQSEGELYRPLLNLRLGAYYFSFVFHRFEGNLTAALAAYNAGPGNADQWIAYYGAERDRFTELIPLLETRTYIREVERQWFIYQALLADTSP